MIRNICLWLLLALFPVTATAEPPPRFCTDGRFGSVDCIRSNHFVFDTCQLIESAAKRHSLDTNFFARLLWQESRFNPNALSPANAQGIAQFIPSTAKLRGLKDSYNPALAIEYSAQYLAEMTRRFGNVGLAAIGYNGGENRAAGFIARTSGLATETQNYVPIITGLDAEIWRDTPPKAHDMRLDADLAFQPACHQMARNRKFTKLRKSPPKPKYKPWGVQVASGGSKKSASASLKRNTRVCRKLLKSKRADYIFKKPQVRLRKGYYVARYSENSRKAAHNLCLKLRRLGCVCAVYANSS